MDILKLRRSKTHRTAVALCTLSFGLLLQACSTDSREALPAGDALYRSQHPVGEEFQTRLLGFDEPVTAVFSGEHAFVGDVAIGRLEGEQLIAPDNQVLHDLAQNALSVQGTGIINASGQKWPGRVIPYAFDGSVSAETRRRFLEAKADYDAKTQIRFVPRTNQRDYVNVISREQKCYSYVGRIGGGQDLSLGSNCSTNAARHEMGHAVGLSHEQVRQDRDRWVTVNAGGSQNAIDNGAAGVPIGPYDFQSMMHYRNYFRDGRWDYVPKNGFPPERVGNDEINSFTQGDLAAIAAIYGYNSGGGNGGELGNSVVCFYYDINYQGKALCLGAAGQVGQVAADWNDRASSVKIAAGYELQVFQDGNFRGSGYTLKSNTADFRTFDFNDLMSSFKVVRATGGTSPSGSVNAPGTVGQQVGGIGNGASKSWNVNVTRSANLRLRVSSSSGANSRSITVSFAGQNIPLSFDAGQTVNVDFPGVGAGTKTLTIRANNDQVSLGKVEFVTF